MPSFGSLWLSGKDNPCAAVCRRRESSDPVAAHRLVVRGSVLLRAGSGPCVRSDLPVRPAPWLCIVSAPSPRVLVAQLQSTAPVGGLTVRIIFFMVLMNTVYYFTEVSSLLGSASGGVGNATGNGTNGEADGEGVVAMFSRFFQDLLE